MKFEIIIKHNKANTVQAIDIMDNIKRMARKRNIDLRNELDFKVEVSENETIFIVPNVIFLNGELYKGKSEDFTKDYLEAYATADGVVVDFGKTITLD